MRFHWMSVYDDADLDSLKKISKLVDDCNYYSVLFVYHSLDKDFWIKCANIINKKHKFKYLIAIRTYCISPEYFVMMYRSFNEIQKNRIMFNIVAGDIHDSESSVDNILLNQQDFNTVEKRVDYTRLWTQKVLSMLDEKDIPEIVMAGTSEKTLESVKLFADYNLCMVDSYMKDPKMFSQIKNRMVCVALVIRNTYEEAERIVDEIDHKHQKRWTIFGTEQQVIEKIKHLESIGVTDLMIRKHRNDNQDHLIHHLVKKNAVV